MQQIEQGAEKPEDFMRDIQAFVKELTVNPQRTEHAETLFPPLREKIGSCPKCGAAVTEHPQGYLCETVSADLHSGKRAVSLPMRKRP